MQACTQKQQNLKFSGKVVEDQYICNLFLTTNKKNSLIQRENRQETQKKYKSAAQRTT